MRIIKNKAYQRKLKEFIRDRNKKIIIFCGAVLVLIISFLYLAFKPFSENRTVFISPGVSARGVISQLAEEHVVKSKWVFTLLCYMTGSAGHLKAGEYDFTAGANAWQVLNILRHNRVKLYHLTVAEGLCVEDIADILGRDSMADKEKFLQAAKTEVIIEKYHLPSTGAEGFLWPETYFLPRGITEEKIIEMMLNKFGQTRRGLTISGIEKGLNIRQLVTLASIVEKEAQDFEEKRIIAGIFLKRLKQNMKLGSCATVLYVLNQGRPMKIHRLYERNLMINSPYNTYRYAGLPPGPICSPGRSSFDAVLNPQDTPYLYFVSMGNGKHEFTSTMEDHLKAKAEWETKQ